MKNRIIKFRAWDKEEKKWVLTKSGGQSLNYKTDKLEYTYSDIFTLQDWETLRMIGAFPANYEIVLFTGLKDKNGKEIYEGDILDCIYKFDGCEKHKLQVVWQEESARFFLKNIGECHQPNVIKTITDMTRSEIIGNIYENPELLKNS